jgi:prepilin-type N-terminal cleavage/methylation domain-containing protein
MMKYKQFGTSIKFASRIRRVKSANSQAGFTIIESLMAMVVVSILMAAIAPVLTLSVATRVQAKRIELGTQAARAYIDGVRSGVIIPPSHKILLSEVDSSTKAFTPDRVDFVEEGGIPSQSLSCTSLTAGYCTNTATASMYCIDRDANNQCSGLKDFIIQAFRSTTSDTVDDTNKGYVLAVRVYRADAFNNGSTLKVGEQQATFTGGLGNKQTPLIEVSTEVISKDADTNYSSYCDRFGGCR